MFTLFIVRHVIFCIFLILVILLQTGKGGGMGTAFGGASQTVFGPRGAGSFIGKITGAVAILFMLTSLILAYLSSPRNSGLAEKVSALNESLPVGEEVNLEEPQKDIADTATTKPDAAPAQENETDAGKPSAPNAVKNPVEAQGMGEKETEKEDSTAQ